MNANDLKGKTIAFAGSGGLDSCTITRWLSDLGVKVVCITLDLGQPDETDLEAVRQRMLAAGASEAIVIDGKEELAQEGLKVIHAQARYEGEYWNTTGLARHVTTRVILKAMKERGIKILSHGATGRGNDQVRFQLVTNMLEPDYTVYAPWRDELFLSAFGGRKQMIDYCTKRGVPVRHSHAKPYSTDANLLGLTHEAGSLESLEAGALSIEPEFGVSPVAAPDKMERIEVRFEKGQPVAINGKKASVLQALQIANEVGGRNGVGIALHLVENRFVGIKSRGVYETPGGTLLVQALRALETLTLDRDAMHEKERLALRYAELVYYGQWFSPLREALEAFMEKVTETVTGHVTLKLFKGSAIVVGRRSEHSLYSANLASFNMTGYTAHDATGFIRLFGLPTRGRKRLVPPTDAAVKAGEELRLEPWG